MKKKNGQRGAFLVLAAVIIPFIFICAGFAADFGKAWAVRAKLQNAADAAVLAGAYQYSSNDQGNVEKLIRTYLSQNSGGLTYSYDKNRDQRNGIFYREPKDGDQSKGILLTLHASAEVPTSFLAMFDVNTLHVGVYSTAKIVKSTPSNSDDVFGYAIMGTGTSDEIRRFNEWNRYSVQFSTNGTHIDGKIYARENFALYGKDNGVIIKDGSQFSTSQKDDNVLWPFGNNEWDPELRKNYTLKWRLHDQNGNDITANGHYVDPIDITLSKDNPKTENIYDFIQEQKKNHGVITAGNMGDHGITADRSKNDGVYIAIDNSSPDWSYNFGDWRTYKTIIAYGNIHIINNTFENLSSNDHLTVVSLHGNITIDGYPPHKLVKGLFYAPNGYIDLKTDTNFEGSMVAKQVMVHQGSGYNIKWDRFDFAGDNSSSGNTGGTGSITLHSDGDSQYESLP